MGHGERPPGDRKTAGSADVGDGGTLPGVGAPREKSSAHIDLGLAGTLAPELGLAATVAPASAAGATPDLGLAATVAPSTPAAAAAAPRDDAPVGLDATLHAPPPAPQPGRAKGPSAGPIGGVDATLASGEPRIRPPARPPATGHAETLAADSADIIGETLDAPPPGAGGTRPGPFKVADLPTLPRVDDTTYAIGDEIARGGMGKILAARDRRLRREVVIKVMRRESGLIDPRFEREALITARLQHPSIVRVYDAGVLGDGRAFYAMERVRGRSLEVVLAEAKTLAERLALLPHAIAVCDALAYAHNEGIVHRDLKPSNVLLGPFGETVVIDWGLAKDLRATEPEPVGLGDAERERSGAGDSSLTQHGAVMGTPSYMAPEQARGEVADERTDIYALGALLYTILSGEPPVRGTSSDEVIDAVASGRRKRIGDAVPELAPELATIVEHAMAHERAERYQSAKTLADDLRAFAAGKLVSSHEYSAWELVKKWVSRHRVPVGIAATALVLLAGFGVYAFQQIRSERDEANRQRHQAQMAQLKAEEARNKESRARNDEKLQQATEAFADDPTFAAALLKQLSDDALGWDATAALAAKLPGAGIALELYGHTLDVEYVLAAPDRTHVATGSDDKTVRWWDLRTRTSTELKGHTGPIDSMTLSSDGRYLATAGTDHLVILWTLATGASRTLTGHKNTVRGVAFSPDNSLLASTSEDGTFAIWDVATASGGVVLEYRYSLRPVTWIDNTSLLVGAFDGSVGRYDVTTKKMTWFRARSGDTTFKAELRHIAVTPDRQYWVTGDEDGHVLLWNAAGTVVRELLPAHNDVAREVIITPDGAHAISAGGDKAVHVYSLPDGAHRALEGGTAGIKDIDLRGDLVAGAGEDGVVRVWRLDGTQVHAWRGHGAQVKGVAFVGDHVVSGAEQARIRMWPLTPLPAPPRGAALRGWLDEHVNLVVRSGRDAARGGGVAP